MMAMQMQMRASLRASQDARESATSLARRARVIAFRLALGEHVTVPAHDPVSEELFEILRRPVPWSVDPGNAAGAVPQAL